MLTLTMSSKPSLLLLLLIIAPLALWPPCHASVFRKYKPRACGKRCTFSPCRANHDLRFGAPNEVAPGRICRYGRDLTRILSVSESLVTPINSTRSDIPISQWRPAGLDLPFAPRFFRPVNMPALKNPRMTKRPSRGSQQSYLDGLCVVVPVTKYEIYGRRGLRIIETEDEDECISFTARVPDVLIEAVWDSGDDMDLSVREPDGTLVNYLHTKSSCGSLGKDNSVDACGIFLRGHERITYQRECLKQGDGKYEAILRHTVNCGHGATSWVLKVVVDGRFRRVIRGVSNGSDEMVAASIKFRL